MNVELIYDQNCPNVSAARTNLMKAFSRTGLPAKWKEWDRNSNETPGYARRFGSPTILINGEDLMGVRPETDANSCRLYGSSGVPPIDLIVKRLLDKSEEAPKKTSGYGLLGTFSIGPGVGAALLAKASCPLCYPAIAAFLSSLGLGFLFKGTYFYIFMTIFFLITLFGLGYRATSRRGYGPLCVGIIGVVSSFSGHYWNYYALFYGGVALLVGASIWNLIPTRNKNCHPWTEGASL